MSTSIILLDQNFDANDVDITVFQHSILFSPAAVWGGGEQMTWSLYLNIVLSHVYI